MTHFKTALISGCDANYFPLLLEWIHSVRAFEESKDMDICILDAGLTEDQREILKPLVASIVNPDWPCDLPAHKIRGREFLKGCVCRPFLPQIFPGYDIYFWMDADTWVQSWRGIDLFLEGAARKKITLTTQADRSYPRTIRIKWLGSYPWKVRGFYFSNACKAFGIKTAKQLNSCQVLLAGAFALHKDAPHWKRWQELVIEAMQKGKVFTAEQLCLGVMCHLENYEVEILPSWAHWLCGHDFSWNPDTNMFVEPYLPHEPLGILHLSGWDELRLDRSLTKDFKTPDGKTINKSYRYPDFDGESV